VVVVVVLPSLMVSADTAVLAAAVEATQSELAEVLAEEAH
jgi:hypothetical protein